MVERKRRCRRQKQRVREEGEMKVRREEPIPSEGAGRPSAPPSTFSSTGHSVGVDTGIPLGMVV